MRKEGPNRCLNCLGFRCLRRAGVCAMHGFVIGTCLCLSAVCILVPMCIAAISYRSWVAQVFVYTLMGYISVVYLSSYCLAIFTPPGFTIPDEAFTSCGKCHNARPMRTHHCSICGRCVLKYDHHCPWIGNCVGLRNHGYFLRFLLFGVLGSLTSCLINIISFITNSFLPETDKRIRIGIFVLGTGIDCLNILACMVIIVSQLPAILHNEIGAEECDYHWVKERCKRLGIPFPYPYSSGLRTNLSELFGERMVAALLLPARIRPTRSGYDYEMSPKYVRLIEAYNAVASGTANESVIFSALKNRAIDLSGEEMN